MAGSGSPMKKSCASCQRYLQHLGGKMKCFLRRMTAGSLQGMVVPDRFVNHFGGNISGTVKLESPNGILYVVEVSKCMNNTVFQCGWEAFVDAHHIEENDSLLFRHIENSHFKVLIFDSDDCERVFPRASTKNTCSIQEKSEDPINILSNSCDDTTQSPGSEGFAKYQKGSFSRSGKTANFASTSSSSEESGEGGPFECESVESGDLQISPEPVYVLSFKSYLSEVQKEKVVALIQEIQPEITVFVAIMRKFNVQLRAPSLIISSGYAAVHFPRESAIITLQSPCKSKKWHPRFYRRKDGNMNVLNGCWLDFVYDNHVQEEDICIFVPAKDARNFTFTVHLLRSARTHSGGEIGGVDRTNTKSDSDISIKEEPTDENVFSENIRNGVSHDSQESENFHEVPADPPYILPHRSNLLPLQKKMVKAKVRAIQSNVPIYVAILKKSNVACTADRCHLELGTRYAAAAHLPDRKQTILLQRMGQRWPIVMEIKGKSRFLVGGWRRFVESNGLRVGDICLFELKKNERKLTMMVHTIFSEQR